MAVSCKDFKEDKPKLRFDDDRKKYQKVLSDISMPVIYRYQNKLKENLHIVHPLLNNKVLCAV